MLHARTSMWDTAFRTGIRTEVGRLEDSTAASSDELPGDKGPCSVGR
jgi:hypothetical protein